MVKVVLTRLALTYAPAVLAPYWLLCTYLGAFLYHFSPKGGLGLPLFFGPLGSGSPLRGPHTKLNRGSELSLVCWHDCLGGAPILSMDSSVVGNGWLLDRLVGQAVGWCFGGCCMGGHWH